ncbi:sigma-54-dependent Fis family transcriptional regulator [Desulfovibrio sp. Huiquan2017]|uniref:sigma-54 interaction domain-containing protein n=1 Tax=Desulfovibrio sp. Huiquan2017 TaxID=2816861 RepID=UPI001A912046|nr:sigma-54-dependent Fis family transcriptional regulator [Desulfovibrio sp. Huiquan2017]
MSEPIDIHGISLASLFLRLDTIQGKDLHRIVSTALETLLELTQASQVSLMIELEQETFPVLAIFNSSDPKPDFFLSEFSFEDLPTSAEIDFICEHTDANCHLKCGIIGAQTPEAEPLVQLFMQRLAGAVAYYGIQQEMQRNTNEMHRLRLNMEYSFNSIPDAIATLDDDMRILSANEAFLALYGGILMDYKGKTLKECFGEASRPYENVIKQTLEIGRITSLFQITTRNPDGRECRLELNAAPLRTGDYSFGGTVLIIKDMTRLAVLEQQLQDRKLLNNMMGKSEALQHIASLVQSLSDLETTVLITGESGTGKELVADALHYNGNRADKRIVKVNCAALSESLLESELFGHIKGAFTGATQASEGRVAAAEGGTLFLDEVGDLPLSIQLKLLRFLEYKKYERVGSSRSRTADVRVITATNADLLQKIQDGSFRKDLYYRLNVFQIELPPLRERKEDIPLLVEHFVTMFNNELARSIKSISPELMDILVRYDWPGNVRELRHCIEYATILCREAMLTPVHLPRTFKDNFSSLCQQLSETPQKTQSSPAHPATPSKSHTFDADVVRGVLEQASGKKAKAARILGISRPTLYRWMKRAGIS